MCVCVCVCVCICVYVYVNVRMYARVCMYVCMYECMYVCTCVRMPACTLCGTYTYMKYVHAILHTSVCVLTLQHIKTLCRQYVGM